MKYIINECIYVYSYIYIVDCLEKRKVKLGPTHAETLITMNKLAGLYNSQGKFYLSSPMYMSIYEIMRKIEDCSGMQDLDSDFLMHTSVTLTQAASEIHALIYEKNSSELRSQNFLTNVEVKIIELKYKSPIIVKKGENAYRSELEYIYNNQIRNLLIAKLCNRIDNNTLILVNHIVHGEQLYDTSVLTSV